MEFRRRHLLGLADLEAAEIELILDQAERLKEISSRRIKKVPLLRGRTVVHFFVEPSTRTRLSFELAAKRLSADTVSLSASTSSLTKGETLIDTARNLEAMSPDVIVIRHACSGAPAMLSKVVQSSVINAGDGMHEHPTQGLLDLMTVKEQKGGKDGRIEGLSVSIIGDVAHSRVARSDIHGFTRLGCRVKVFGPATLMPMYVESLGVERAGSMAEAVEDADVIILLRMQRERLTEALIPSLREYAVEFGLNTARLEQAKPDVIIMHPGPLNRGVEITPEVADGPWSVILDQVENGVAVRMALLFLLLGEEES
ncbi:MAG: aspartate carbamoyltransferase catalytic subunit [Proteobacteria bacterium]|nr:aspartate carbamoyltransferase catalytic subunit [Pseudomonadota bacterium]MBU1740394.1 aspartate carbamoyltransferase catalytic subunit [Pseudomonadota bacterium]